MWNNSPFGRSKIQNWMIDSAKSYFLDMVTEVVTEDYDER